MHIPLVVSRWSFGPHRIRNESIERLCQLAICKTDSILDQLDRTDIANWRLGSSPDANILLRLPPITLCSYFALYSSGRVKDYPTLSYYFFSGLTQCGRMKLKSDPLQKRYAKHSTITPVELLFRMTNRPSKSHTRDACQTMV